MGNQNEEIDVCNGDMYALFKNIFCNLNNNHVKNVGGIGEPQHDS